MIRVFYEEYYNDYIRKDREKEFSSNVGVYCPVPNDKDKHGEFENPTKAEELTLDKCRLICIRNSHPKDRDVSVSVALFCMMRSGYSNLT